MNTEQRTAKLPDGTNFHFLVYSDNKYVWPVMIWMALHRRHKAAANTIKNELLHLKKFYNYSEDLHISIDELIISKEFDKIITHFFDYSMYLKVETDKNGKPLSSNVINNRIYAIKRYLYWSLIYFCGDRTSLLENKKRLDLIVKSSKMKTKDNRHEFKCLKKNEQEYLSRIIELESPLNPFPQKHRLRNYIIVKILLETGARIAEVLKIKTVDIIENNNSYYINLVSNINDPTDTRSSDLGFKTLCRTIAISEDLFSKINLYIDTSRNPNNKKNKHLYLITSIHLKPLSVSGVHKIFNQLKDASKVQGLTPHSLRHTFATNYLEFLVNKQNMNLESALDELKYLCGWSVNSRMPERYGRQFIATMANDMNRKRLNYSKWGLE